MTGSNSSALVQQFGVGYAESIGGGISGTGFIARFDDQNGARDWGTLFGGLYSYPKKIKTDNSGNVYVVGNNGSGNMGTLTCSPPAFAAMPICDPGGTAFVQQTQNGGNILYDFFPMDGFIARFNSNTELTWSTYFGGERDDYLNNLAIDDVSDKLYVVGRTRSIGNGSLCGGSTSAYPLCDAGGGYFQENVNGTNSVSLSYDGTIARFSLDGTLEWSTFYGGFGDEEITGIDVVPGSVSHLFVTGYTSTDTYHSNTCVVPNDDGFPHCLLGSGGYDQNFGGGQYDAFIVRFSGNATLQWSTYIGGDLNEGPETRHSIVSDPNEFYPPGGPVVKVSSTGYVNMYGNTRSLSTTGSTVSVPILNNSSYYNESLHQDSHASQDNTDVFINQFTIGGDLLWGTYFGGTGTLGSSSPRYGDRAGGITTYQDRVYICGTSYSTSNFPLDCPATVMPYCQPYTTVSSSYSDVFVAQLNVLPVTGIQEIDNIVEGIVAYPNPSNNLFNLRFVHHSEENLKIEIVDLLGKNVFNGSFPVTSGVNTYIVNLDGFSSGLYFLSLTGKSENYQVKLIKQ